MLPQLGQLAAAVSQQMEPLLNSTNVNVRYAAICALWEIVPSRQFELLPRLEEFAKSQNESTRDHVGRKLARLQPLTQQVVDMLAAAVQDSTDGFR